MRKVSFHLRLTEDEREMVREMARRERRSDNSAVRIAIAEAAARRGLAQEEAA